MKRTIEIRTIHSMEEIPTIESIRETLLQKHLIFVFLDQPMQTQRQAIGQKLRKMLDDCVVGIHTVKPEISINKLITDDEIDANQDFFEKCAKDYRKLSTMLINKLADKLGLIIDERLPLLTFNPIKASKKQSGEVEGWQYFLHGYHCCFKNKKTGRLIETSLVSGFEFGDLDPYFFIRFIKSSPEYQPLPVGIYEDYEDGVRINKKMLALGKFERITTNYEERYGIVVADRDKVTVNSYRPE